MPAPEKQVRVFISSTFRDMHAERDHLVTVVFPELRERVEQLGLEFFDVDLRWGVPTKDLNGETANSWEYCRQWIDRVEPFFVCILGQRYGWVPEPGQFREPADRERQEQEPRSITDLEVRHAVLDSRRKRRSYFYLRATPVPEPNTEYVDPPEYQDRLVQLKAAVRQCGRPVHDYHPEWTGERFAGMEEFGRFVLEDLWSGVLRDERYVSKDVWRQVLGGDPENDRRYTDESQPVPRELWEKIVALAKPPPRDPLDAERQQMDAFAVSRLRWFQGRAHELQQLTDFIQSTAADAPRLAVVAAVPGQGKSALLAKLSTLIPQPSTFLITHFVGATERSAAAHALVERLLGELDRSGIEWPADEQKEGEEPKRDFNSLCNRLRQRLGDYAGESRVVILIDALNQLTDGHNLVWLPHRLGASVRVVVSCVDDKAAKPNSPETRVLQALASRQPAPLRVPLGELTADDVRIIVKSYLDEYCKELDTPHVNAVCRMEQARNPLYLLVMLGELRTLGGNDMNRIVGERIAALPHDYPDTVSLFRWVLQRLEVFGAEAAQWWCLYLAHGRVGMASHELADLLARKLPSALGAGVPTAPSDRPQVSQPASTALLIERGLRRYLLHRGGQLDFFHGQLRQAVMEQYSSHADPATVHRELAEYFHSQDYFLESLEEQRVRAKRLPPTSRPANVRKVDELPWQRLKAAKSSGEWDEVEKLLTDLFFLEAKAEAGMGFDLALEYTDNLSALPKDRPQHRMLLLLREAIYRDLHFIARHPTTLFQCLWNTCWWYDSPELAKHYAEANENDSNPAGDLSGAGLCDLMEHWRKCKEDQTPGFTWLRDLRPPRTALGSPLSWVITSDEAIWSFTIAKDGRNLITAGFQTYETRDTLWDEMRSSKSENATIREFEGVSGKEIRTPRHAEGFLAFSADGAMFASRQHEAIHVFSTETGGLLYALPSINATQAAFSADGTRIAFDSRDTKWIEKSDEVVLNISDGQTGVALFTLRGVPTAPTVMTISNDGHFLATGHKDGIFRIWNCSRNTDWKTPPSPIQRCDYESLEEYRDAVIDRATPLGGEFIGENGGGGSITALSWSRIGRRLVVGTQEGFISLWDITEKADCVYCTRQNGSSTLRALAFSYSDITLLVERLIDKTMAIDDYLWGRLSPTTKQYLQLPGIKRSHPAALRAHLVDDLNNIIRGPSIYAADRFADTNLRPEIEQLVLQDSQRNDLQRLNRLLIEDAYPRAIPRTNTSSAVTCLGFSQSDDVMASGCIDGNLNIWSVSNGKKLKTLQVHREMVHALAFHPLQSVLVSASNDRTVQFSDWLTTNSTKGKRRVDGFNTDGLCISLDGGILALGWAGKAAIRLIRLSDWVELGDISMHGDRVKTIAFTSDSRRVAAVAIGLQAIDVNLFYMWDISTKQCVLQQMDFEGKYDNISHMKLCPIEMVGIDHESIMRVKGATNASVNFPNCLQSCISRSHGRLWSGICGDQVFVLSLEGDISELAEGLPGSW